jgi:putative phosphoesterase
VLNWIAVEVAIISDTHMPRGGRRLPDACVERLAGADLIIHAGDFSALSVLNELQAYGRVVGVHGNVDEAAIRAWLPTSRKIDVAGVKLGLVHDGGAVPGRAARLRRRFPDCAGVIFGHSHIPLHERAPDGFQIFNPGSPTERRSSPHHTMGTARVDPAGVRFELVILD